MASDLRLAFQHEDPTGAFLGARLHLKAAHKQVQVKPDEHGLLMFQHRNTLFHYRVCHFGARFSAYWWQWVGALILRILHHLLASWPHKAWLYVDDLLAALIRSQAPQQLALMVVIFVANRMGPHAKKSRSASAS